MSISSSLYSGVSGLNANANAMTVIGNNIANANTAGFKSGRANFSDVISQTLSSGANSSQLGRGVHVSSVSNTFTQGSLESTESVTDLALEGEGFFIVNDGLSSFYTRAGKFIFDKDGDLVNTEGLKVQGWSYDSNGNLSGAITDINFAAASSVPNATDSATLSVNLDSRETAIAVPGLVDPNDGAFDLANLANNSDFSTGLTVYDSQGNAHTVITYFTKIDDTVGAEQWRWNAVVDGGETQSGSTEVGATGILTFDSQGRLSDETSDADGFTNNFNFSGGVAQGQSIAFDFGDSLAESGGTGLAGSTQFGSESAVSFLNQNGYATGTLQSLSINQDGLVTGFFTNGQTKPLAVIAVARFKNLNGLNKIGNNLFTETYASGQRVVSQGGAGGAGKIQSNTLEQSNVDLAQEFVKMITTQRAFQANSRTISTTDEMMAEVINIKR